MKIKTIIYRSGVLPMLDLEVVEQAVRGKIKVKCPGLDPGRDMGLDLRLRPPELAAYEEAKRNRFVVCNREGRGKGGMGGPAGAYFHWCEAQGEPYVRVLKRKAYAEVTLDMISTNRRLDEWAIRAMRQALCKFSLPKARLYWGECYNKSSRVRLEEAERLAAILYALATDFKPRV